MSFLHAHGPRRPGASRSLLNQALGAALLTATAAAPAAQIVENQSTAFDAVQLIHSSLHTGTVIDEGTSSFQTTQFCCAGFSWSINGTFATKVVKALDGTIDFYFQVETAIVNYLYAGYPTPPFKDAWNISDLYLGGFHKPGFNVHAGYIADGGGDWAPTSAMVHDASFPDWQVPYANGVIDISIQPTSGKSKWFFLDTDADSYASAAALSAYGPIWWRSGSQEVQVFNPVAAPEPASWLLLAPGLALLHRVVRRRR